MRAIYKQYTRSPKFFRKQADKRYWKFLSIIAKIQGVFPPDSIHFYIRRYTSGLADKNFWDEKARRYYFKFWIKRAERSGFIERVGLGWRVTDKLRNFLAKREDLNG